jgi:putative N6-adenine-specific DNA methylase
MNPTTIWAKFSTQFDPTLLSTRHDRSSGKRLPVERDRRRALPSRVDRRYFAACALGLEEVLARELRDLSAGDVAARRGGVSFAGDPMLGYRAAMWLRSAMRLQELVLETPAPDRQTFYRAVSAIDWERYLRLDQTLAVDATVRDSRVTHSGIAALTVKDAIVDRFRSRRGARPSVDRDDPALALKLLVNRDVATLWRDLSGESLHKRGWRPIQVKSPLNEALAAGLLMLTEWDRRSPLVDPMCGSGTFLIEAAHLAMDRAPGLERRFAFERWPDFDQEAWAAIVAEARARVHPAPVRLEGADRHEGALALAKRSAEAAGVADAVGFTVADARDFAPPVRPHTVVANPPWGERLGEGEELVDSWRGLGNFFHRECGGAAVYVLSGNAELTRHLGLRATRKWVVMSGPIECRFIRYDVREKAPPPT